MNFLIDTHVLLWWLAGTKELSDKAKALITEADNSIWISVATIWEIRIKEGIGKLRIPKQFKSQVEDSGFNELPINSEHAHAISNLPLHHRDPFDRMLIAQAIGHDFTILTHDDNFSSYDAKVQLV